MLSAYNLNAVDFFPWFVIKLRLMNLVILFMCKELSTIIKYMQVMCWNVNNALVFIVVRDCF